MVMVLIEGVFLFVEDAIKAFDLVLHKGHQGEIYNIGTSFEISTYDLARKLVAKYGKTEEKYIKYYDDRPFNDCRYSIDATKLYNLGWKPKVDFDQGLDITIQWYRHNFNNWKNVEAALVPGTKPTGSIV